MGFLKSKKGQMILCIIIAVAAVLFVEVFSNWRILSLPEADRGIQEISLLKVTSETVEVSAEGIIMRAGSRLSVTIEEQYVDRFYYHIKHEGPLDATIRIGTYNDYGQEMEEIIRDACSEYLNTSYVIIQNNVRYLTIEFSFPSNSARSDEVTILDMGFQNQFLWNHSRMLLTAAIVLLLGSLWIFRECFSFAAEKAFLIIAVGIGILMILLLPANKVAWDEEIHFYRSYCVAEFPGGFQVSDTIYNAFCASEATWPYNQPDTLEEQEAYNQYLDETGTYDGTDYMQGRALAGVSTSGYLSQALFVKIGLLLNLPFSWVFRLGRLGNLLFYAIVMYWAIKILPLGKRILSVVGLMPTTLFLACVYSCDATIIACVSLGMAIVIRELLTPEKKIDWKSYWVCGIALVCGILPKAIYAPLVLLALLLPKEKFLDSKQRVWMKTGVVLAFLFLMATFVLPTILNPGAIGDDRGGVTSGASQISLILGDPVAYIKILAYEIWRTLPEYLCGSQVFGQLGHLIASPAGLLMPILTLFVFFTDREPGIKGLRFKEKVWFFFSCGTCMVLIWTALYLSYTVPGASEIAGVQPRYYLPLLLPIAMIFFSDKITVQWERVKYQMVLSAASAGILFWTIWHSIYLPMCR